ncbi:MAG: WbuC family cupin fold metalloprotein [Bacteroidota bacterium]|nr:WbuC family cupin fold metalloprotein [Bacteroidota bacterium]
MKKITTKLLDEVSRKAINSPRKRMNHNFHEDLGAALQRLLNSMEPYSYVRPHRHADPDREEVFVVLRGTLLAIQFDDAGEITDCIKLNADEGNYGVEIPSRVYHTVISLEPGSVAFEVKNGPFIPKTEGSSAPWAPAEGTPEAEMYVRELVKRSGF